MSILSVDQISPIGSGTTITLNATEVKTGNEITVGTGASIFSPAGNTLALGTNNVERIRIKNDGKIGIGTNNPQAMLEVQDRSGGTLIGLSVGTQYGNASFGGYNNYPAIMNNTAQPLIYCDTNNDRTIFFGDTVGFGTTCAFRVNGAERLRIDSSGRLIQRYSAAPYGNRAATFQSPAGETSTYIAVVNTETNGASGILFGDHAGQNAGNYDAYINYSHQYQHLQFLVGSGTERIRILSNGHVAIGDDISNDTGMFKVVAADGQSDDLYVGQFKNLEATTNRNWGLLIQAGSSSTDESLRIRNGANNADHLTVRGDGVVTKPQTPTFSAKGSGDAISAQSPLPYDSMEYNNGNHYNNSTFKFTCPVTGYYYVTCHVVPTNFSTPNNVELYIKDQSGNRYFLDRKVKSNNYSTNNFSVGGSRILYKSAGNTLWVEFNSINGSPTLESSSHFGIMLMA